MTLAHVHISKGVSKLGASIPSVSLPPGETCRPDAPCFAKCYARKGRFRFPKVKSLAQTNLELWHSDPLQYERDIQIAAYPSRFFRWHVSGDIPDSKYLDMMVHVAESLPNTKFLSFTKQYEIVNDYIEEHGNLPDNLVIVLSEWGDFHPENPNNLPLAYVRLKGVPQVFPPYAKQCDKYCGECVLSDSNCWNLTHGQAVVFDEH